MLRLGEEFAVGVCEGQNCLAVCEISYGHQILGKISFNSMDIHGLSNVKKTLSDNWILG